MIVLNVLQGVHALLIKWDTGLEDRKKILKEVVGDFLPIIKDNHLKSVKALKKQLRAKKQGFCFNRAGFRTVKISKNQTY